jgi:hypothetical protein
MRIKVMNHNKSTSDKETDKMLNIGAKHASRILQRVPRVNTVRTFSSECEVVHSSNRPPVLRSLFYVKQNKVATLPVWSATVASDAFILDLEDSV